VLVNLLQSKHLDIAKAIQFAEITCSNLTSFKTDIDGAVSFNSLYDDCFEICESRGIDTPQIGVNAKRKRNENSTITNEKEKFLKSHDKIIDIYVKEIQDRFQTNNLEPVLELYKVIMLDDKNTKINFEILKIYDRLLDLVDLSLELPSYIKYKQLNDQTNWKQFDILVKEFEKKQLKDTFKQIYSVIKLYLTIPTNTCEGERDFSALKRIKSFLRTTMTNDRLSDLAILNIANDIMVNYEEIVNDFANLRNRLLAFF
jgi:phosphoribosyl-dephospho-CoA transferase